MSKNNQKPDAREIKNNYLNLTRKQLVFWGVILCVLVVLLIAVYIKRHSVNDSQAPVLENIPSSIGPDYEQEAKETLIEKENLEEEQARAEQLKSQSAQDKEIKQLKRTVDEDQEATQKMQQQMDDFIKHEKQTVKPASSSETSHKPDDYSVLPPNDGGNQNNNMNAFGQSQQVNNPKMQKMARQMSIFGNEARRSYTSVSSEPSADELLLKHYYPAGTFATGVLLTGAVVDAGINSATNGTPIDIRLTTNAILPNKRRMPMKGCFMVTNGTGDISSQRVFINLVRISCIDTNGKKYEAKVYGIANGLSGEQGLKGHLVLQNDKIVESAFWAGVASSAGDAGATSFTTQQVSGSNATVTNTVNPENAIPYAALKGIGKAGNKLGEYLMKLADMYHPALEIHGGSKVNVWFEKGFYLTEVKPDSQTLKTAKEAVDVPINRHQPVDHQTQAVIAELKRAQQSGHQLNLGAN
jgi:conjugal transfer pilus assembly protein TraB